MHRPVQPFRPGCEFPRFQCLQAVPAMGFSSLLESASFGAAGCKSPGCPAFSTVLPRLSIQSSGLPESSIFRLFRRWFFEFPRAPHPSALPTVDSPGFPVSSTCQLRLAMSFRVSPIPHLPGAGDGSSSFLESRILRLCLRRISKLPWLSASSIASRSFPGSPRFLNLPALPAMVPRVSSSPASFSGPGGVKLRVAPSPRSSSIACR